MPVSEPVRSQLVAEAKKRGLIESNVGPLWPAEYAELNAECASRFIFEHVKTFEETSGQDWPIPRHSYLEQVAEAWHDQKRKGESLHIVKSRRLIVSWFVGALELHAAGCARSRIVIAAQTYEGINGSCQFVWRAAYMYKGLRARNPDWRLPDLYTSGSERKNELDSIALTNGSVIQAVNSQGGSFQGGGVSIARVEELSKLPNVNTVVGQAAYVTQGPPGEVGGFVCSVSNASDNPEWLELIQRA